MVKWKNTIATINVITRVNIYESVSDVVYPKYFLTDPMAVVMSGFSEHSVHLCIGFGIFGATLHGIIGIRIDVTNAAAEIIPEYINFFLNCMF